MNMSKVVLIALCLFAAAMAARSFAEDKSAFDAFVSEYGRSYKGNEYAYRLSVFRTNLDAMERMRVRHPRAKFGINDFADMSESEFRATRLSAPLNPTLRNAFPTAAEYAPSEMASLPRNFSWVEKGAVTPVKNQGDCGSCWSFSTTGSVEGQWQLAGNKLTSLSEQNLMDCDSNCGTYRNETGCDSGCDGGLQPNAFKYIIDNKGIDTEASYPYEAAAGSCRFSAANVGATIDSYTMVSENEEQMQQYLYQNGPISIAADAAEWQYYVGGVFSGPCGTTLDHGILIVGWGREVDWLGTYDYWIVKNSWGASWGIDGYLHIIRNVGECGLNLFASSAVISK